METRYPGGVLLLSNVLEWTQVVNVTRGLKKFRDNMHIYIKVENLSVCLFIFFTS